MSILISPFKVTSEDLANLDQKTRAGLEPLLDDLNVTIQQLVRNAQIQADQQLVPVSIITGASVATSFPLVFKTTITKPQAVLLANIIPNDPNHVMTAPFVMQGFRLTDAGLVSIPFVTGLLPNNGYQMTFLVR